MRDALQAIGDAAGVPDFGFNAKGACELVINGALQVYFQEMSDTEMEVTTRVDWLDNKLDASMIDALLAANSNTRAGRFSIEPNSNKVYFGGRLNVTAYDEKTILKAVDAIIIEAAKWNVTSEGDLRASAGGDAAVDVLSETLIRV